jgi:hypothetical protein
MAYFLSTVINFPNMYPPPPGTVTVHSEVIQAEVALQVMSESQATDTSDKTAPETQESQMTPSPVPTARRRFGDISPISSISPTNKIKIGESQVQTHPKFIRKLKERKTSAAGRKKGYAKRHINNRTRQANHGADDILSRVCSDYIRRVLD